jgi:prepilin-type N-terminal cleavage/methylation domain-containing protein
MKQRKGFTLIELMIVIAIIIILAAIAIPNYLRMTDRARRSRVAGDFTSIATALEAFSVDWGGYPNTPGVAPAVLNGSFGKHNPATVIRDEIIGGATAKINLLANTTLTGEKGGIDYIKAGTVDAMYNPFAPNATTDYFYASSASGNHWVLAVQYNATIVLYKTDTTTDLTEKPLASVITITISDAALVGP